VSTLKHRILYVDHEWRQQRILALALVLGGIFFSYQAIATHVRGPLWLVYLPFAYAPAGLLLGAFYLWKRSHVTVCAAEDGVHVGRTFSTHVIPYDSIRTARVLPLRQLVPDGTSGRKRYLAPPVKANLDTPSLVLRFQGEPAEIAAHAKKLGARHIFDGSAVFPVRDAEGAAREIARHLPEGTGSNLGGARRRGRKRR
jgi:hypothetical protein